MGRLRTLLVPSNIRGFHRRREGQGVHEDLVMGGVVIHDS